MILVSGVRRRGTQLAATPRHVIDRPELYLAKRLYDVSLSGKTSLRFAVWQNARRRFACFKERNN